MAIYQRKVIPVTHTSEVDDGDILFIPTMIPNVLPTGRGAILKQVMCVDLDDKGADIELLFFGGQPTIESIGAAAAKWTFAGGNDTDANVGGYTYLGGVLMDVGGGPAGTAVKSQDGRFHESRDQTDNQIYITRGINMPVYSGGSGKAPVLDRHIWFFGIATGTHTYTAAGLEFTFVFES